MAPPDKANVVSIVDLLQIVRRRIVIAIIPAVLVIGSVSIYAYKVAQPKFRAKALLAIESSADPTSSTSEPVEKVQAQLRVVREVIFSDAIFQSIVKQFDLMKTTHAADPARAIEEIKSRIKIEVEGVDAFYIEYEGNNRQQVADVTNRIADMFVEQTSTRQEKRSGQEVQLIDSEVDRLKSRLTGLDLQVQAYKESAVTALPERLDANFKSLQALQVQIDDKSNAISTDEANRAGAVAQMKELEKQGALETSTPVMKSENEKKLEDARLELSNLKARGRTDRNPEVITKQAEIQNLQKVVAAEPKPAVVRTVSAGQIRYNELKAQLETIDRHLVDLKREKGDLQSQTIDYTKRIDASPRTEQALAQLKRDYDTTKDQYDAQLKKQLDVHRTQQLEKISSGLVFRVVEPAQTPLDPFSLSKSRLLALGLLAGIGLGLGAVFLAEHVDSTFKDVDEFQAQTGLTVLSIIPKIAKPKSHKTTPGANPVDTIVTIHDKSSIATEQFQILAMRLRHRTGSLGSSVTLVSSSAGGEGKTVSSVNLAIALSNDPTVNVLLIDADLRKPRVHEYLGLDVPEGRGLGNLLGNQDDDFSRYFWKVGSLTVMPGGSHVENPLGLLASARFRSLLSSLREQFQFIVIDSPPIIPLADGLVLSGLSDQAVLVVRAQRTQRAVLRRALETFGTTNLAGVILNDVDIRHSKYAYAYKYYQSTYLGRT